MDPGQVVPKKRVSRWQEGVKRRCQGVLECFPTSPYAKLPVRGTPGSAGMDLFATHNVKIKPREHAVVSLGMQMKIPVDKQGVIFARSGLAVSHMMVCGGGVVDQDYRGDVKVIAMNLGDKVLEVSVGMRIAQLVLNNADSTVPVWGTEVDNTARGSSGFWEHGIDRGVGATKFMCSNAGGNGAGRRRGDQLCGS